LLSTLDWQHHNVSRFKTPYLNMKLAGHQTLENENSIQPNRDSWERVTRSL